MKEIPLIFTGPMVSALLEDRKTQTRRLTGRILQPGDRIWVKEIFRVGSWTDDGRFAIDYAVGPVGKTPWCRPSEVAVWYRLAQQSLEDCAQYMAAHEGAADCRVRNDGARYTWEVGDSPCRWRSSMFMPRWASRILLEVTAPSRMERLSSITESDITAEGITAAPGMTLGQTFMELWDSLHKPGVCWYTDPFVCVHTFKRVTSSD